MILLLFNESTTHICKLYLPYHYRDVIPHILEAKKNEEQKVGNCASSEIQKGTSRHASLCCNQLSGTSCEPFPKCCNCEIEHRVVDDKFDFSSTDLPLLEIIND